MLGIKIKAIDGMHFLTGQIDEHIDLADLLEEASPLKLNFAGVRHVNSMGVRAFVLWMKRLKDKTLEFHECTAGVLDMINSIPGTLGTPTDASIVKSILIDYRCTRCKKEETHLFKITYIPDNMPVIPTQSCARCESQAEPTMMLEDYFTYMLV